MNKIYPTDLTDSQWNHIKDFFPEPKKTARAARGRVSGNRECDFVSIIYGVSMAIYSARLSLLADGLSLFCEVER